MAIESGKGRPNPGDLPQRGIDMPNTGSFGEGISPRGIRGIPQKGITSSEGIPTTQSPFTGRETGRKGNVNVSQMSAGDGGEKGKQPEEPKPPQEPASAEPSPPSGETPHAIPPVGRESASNENSEDVRETLREQGVPESVLKLLNEKGVARDYADTFRDAAAMVGDPKSTVTQLGDAAKEAAEEVPYYSDYIADVVRQHLESEGVTGEKLDRRTDEISETLAGDAVPAAKQLDDAVDAYVDLAESDNPMDITRALSGGAKTIEEVFGARDEGGEVSGVEEVAEKEDEVPKRVTTVIKEKPKDSTIANGPVPSEVQELQRESELEEHIAGEPPEDPKEYEEYRKKMNRAGELLEGRVPEIDPLRVGPSTEGEDLFGGSTDPDRRIGVTEREQELQKSQPAKEPVAKDEGDLFRPTVEPRGVGRTREHPQSEKPEIEDDRQEEQTKDRDKEEGDPPAPGVSELRMSTGDPEISVAIDRDEVLEFGRGADDYYEIPEVSTPKVPIPEGQSSIVFDDGEYTYDGPELDEPDTDRYR